MNNIIEKIQKSNNIVLLCHINPDGDAIGSVLSFYHALKYLGKNVDAIVRDAPQKFSFLEGFSDIKKESAKEYDLAIVVDTATKNLVNCVDILDRVKETIVIDHHHLSNANYGNINYVKNRESCCSVIYEILSEMNIPLTPQIATPICMGILTDSGGLAYPLVNKQTFLTMAHLSEIVNVSDIYKKVLKTKSRSRLALERIYLQNLEFYEDDQIAFSYITEKDIAEVHAPNSECDGLVNIAQEIENVKISIIIRAYSDKKRVSIRTNEDLDANRVAAPLGGGGHQNASGCIVDMDFSTLKEKLLYEARNELNEWNNRHKQAKRLYK